MGNSESEFNVTSSFLNYLGSGIIKNVIFPTLLLVLKYCESGNSKHFVAQKVFFRLNVTMYKKICEPKLLQKSN